LPLLSPLSVLHTATSIDVQLTAIPYPTASLTTKDTEKQIDTTCLSKVGLPIDLQTDQHLALHSSPTLPVHAIMNTMTCTTGAEDSQPTTTILPAGFDVYTQDFQIYSSDGTLQTLSTIDIDNVRLIAVRTAIIFAVQLGASAVLLLVLLLMTQGNKRRSLSWVFNVLALVCNVIRCTIQCTEMTGPFLNFVLVTLQEYGTASLGKHIRISIANSVMTTLVFVFIEMALVTQVHVICAATMPQLWRLSILSFCGVVAMLAVGFRFNLMIRNCEDTANLGKGIIGTPKSNDLLDWAQSTSNIMAIVSICVFSAVFCTKLGLAIRSRHQMGLKQFGAMQIIFIMGCQTLTLPGKSCTARFSTAALLTSFGSDLRYPRLLCDPRRPAGLFRRNTRRHLPPAEQHVGVHQR
jgi:pheromone alpha factor receptor